ncbi:MAG: hypothetical protein V7670_06125 [Maribacter arcticus]|uniref:hypothetical protein n=1 Tax=Maribacter arcticus TaxID=561365 RepID=UPI003001123B
MQDDIIALEPKDRLKVLLELAKFVIPTLKATELSTKEDLKKIEVNIIRTVHGKDMAWTFTLSFVFKNYRLT